MTRMMKRSNGQPPVFCVVGVSNSGKTTLIEKLIGEFKERGYRVGTVKHHHGEFEIDHSGKDTWRHARAGADVVFISAPHKAAMVKRVEEELTLDQVVALMGEVDLVLAEGYKNVDRPQIEVCNEIAGGTPICLTGRRVCIVGQPYKGADVPCFHSEDAKGVVDFLEELLKDSKLGI